MPAAAINGRPRQMRRIQLSRPLGGRGGKGPPRASSIILGMVLTMLGLLLGAKAVQFLIETLFSLLAAS
ncbi:hypothetical protein ASE63_23575 [Bosea sp. Root381]|uniref:hypothetical protein n=1 Tax=Bosea sp. Root381 TaxID=1736524 RepID=UPI000700EBA9|nr:hypothetical protein [Bosea sp. Root381]KRE06693.1 hypothetical protein ASE63_23575 [Bosea sp. Root381]